MGELEGVRNTYGKAMTGSEIARELGITRQAVSQALKRAIRKLYDGLMKEGLTDGPIDTVMFMREWLNITEDEDIQQFFEL